MAISLPLTGRSPYFVILDTDILTCAVNAINDTQALQTYVGGNLVSAPLIRAA
jgi:predicted amidohydrolase YtcJ